MAEAEYVTAGIYGLQGGGGKGPALFAARIKLSDGETLTTNLRKIEGIGHTVMDADLDANTPVVAVSCITTDCYGA